MSYKAISIKDEASFVLKMDLSETGLTDHLGSLRHLISHIDRKIEHATIVVSLKFNDKQR